MKPINLPARKIETVNHMIILFLLYALLQPAYHIKYLRMVVLAKLP